MVKLGEVARLINGRAYQANELLEVGKYPVLRVGNLFTSEHWYYSNLELESDKLCDRDDLLFAWSASFGPFIWQGPKAIYHYHIWKIECGNNLDSQYAYYALQLVTESIKQSSHGMAMLHMTKAGMEQVTIPLPPLTEQKRIAAILNDKLAAVEAARKAAETQLEAARALPAAYLREVFESEEAKGWEKISIAALSDTCSGTTPSRSRSDYYGGKIPWIKTGELRDGTIVEAEETVTELAVKETSLTLLPSGTLLIAMYGQGQTRGRTGLLAVEATTNQACFAILPNPNRFVPRFLQLWFMHNYASIRKESEFRGGNQPNLNGEFLKALEVSLPSIDEQSVIVDKLDGFLNKSSALTASCVASLAHLSHLSPSLLRQAFRGEL